MGSSFSSVLREVRLAGMRLLGERLMRLVGVIVLAVLGEIGSRAEAARLLRLRVVDGGVGSVVAASSRSEGGGESEVLESEGGSSPLIVISGSLFSSLVACCERLLLLRDLFDDSAATSRAVSRDTLEVRIVFGG